MKKRLFICCFFVLMGFIISCSDAGVQADEFGLDREDEKELDNSKLDLDKVEDETELDENEGDLDDEEDEEDEEDEDTELKTVLLNASVLSETEIVLEFSFPVTLLSISLSFDPDLEFETIEEGSIITLILEDEIKPGLRFNVELDAEDEQDIFFSEQIELISVNRRPPELLINELRTEYTSASGRSEFIEFKIITGGNLGGLRVFAAGNVNPLIYEFKPVEVNAGDYVVLHLRTLDPSSVDEYDDDLSLSGGRDASPHARDLWIPGSTKLLRKTDAVYVMDLDDNVLDAVMLALTPASSWSNVRLAEAAEFLHKEGAFTSADGGICSPADAVSTADIGTSLTRSISRDENAENSRTAADWYVTATGNFSPGEPNKP